MWRKNERFLPRDQRGPLRVLFANTSLPVGGAETLLVNLVRSLDRERFLPEICCLKQPGPLGEILAREVPVHSRLLTSKYDLRVYRRLCRLLRQRQIDALVTVGAGDKMFWGRLAAWRVGLPVVLSALHSTGWPDEIGALNRRLTRITDRFIAVARDHGRFLVEQERFPVEKVCVIPNGVDVTRFSPNPAARQAVRRDFGWHDDVPLFGIVAALRPEKNHLLFLRAAKLIQSRLPDARFLIVGEGPQREQIEVAARSAGLADHVVMTGARNDIPDLLAALDLFVLSSRTEANPVSIIEAMATGLPVVATRVGSVHETVLDGQTGFLVDSGDAQAMARCCLKLATHPALARDFGLRAREQAQRHGSLQRMVEGYQQLIESVYRQKCGPRQVADAEHATGRRQADVPQAAQVTEPVGSVPD